ncbi:MAG: LysR substrate-binding domain-containing protein [Polaromonas sp.]
MVASGLGIAMLPKTAAQPIMRAMKLSWRPLADPWAKRCLLVAKPQGQNDVAINALIAFLVQPSQNANTAASKQ